MASMSSQSDSIRISKQGALDYVEKHLTVINVISHNET